MNYRKKYPKKVQGNKCVMCQGEKMMGNSKNSWYRAHQHQTKSERKRVDLVQEGWQ